MALQSLNLGTNPDDGTGDTLRIGGDKINDNFSEIYTLLGTGNEFTSGLSATATVVTLSSAVGTFTTLTPVSADGAALGSASLEWSDLFLADGAVINLGSDQDVTLTHVADTGILLNSTRQLQFGDSGTYIHQSADGVLDLVSDTEIEINATTIDINGNADVSGTVTFGSISDGAITVTAFVDEDNMSSNSATLIPTQQSVKAYVDSEVSSSATSFVLEDDDGTEVTVSNSKEVKFIGAGVTTNWTDTSNGTDGDPYDLTFTVDAAQTGITSLLATDIKIGEDDQTKIDFETADEIHFYAANAHQIKLVDGALVPVTDNDIDLGTSSLEFKDAFFDGTVTSDAFAGPLTGNVTGNVSGTAATVTGAAQSNITSLGTLTALTVDNVVINGATIGHGDDTDLMTVADGVLTVAGEVSMTTLDIGGTNVTSTAAELNVLDGITAVVGELNALDIGSTAVGTAVASKAVILDSNKDYTGVRNLTITGEIDAATGDFSGAADFGGNLSVGSGRGDANEGGQIDLFGAASYTSYDKSIDSYQQNLRFFGANTFTAQFFATGGSQVANMSVTGEISGATIAGTVSTATQNSITTMTGLVTTGALNSGSITSGFGTINNGSSTITTTGAVATGTITAGGAITSTGDITAFSSDPRLKNFKGKINNPLEKLNKINGYYYEWNDLAKEIDSSVFKDGLAIGVDASEIEAVMPEIVDIAPIVAYHNLDVDYKTVHYDLIVPLLIEAVKELQAEVMELKSKGSK